MAEPPVSGVRQSVQQQRGEREEDEDEAAVGDASRKPR